MVSADSFVFKVSRGFSNIDGPVWPGSGISVETEVSVILLDLATWVCLVGLMALELLYVVSLDILGGLNSMCSLLDNLLDVSIDISACPAACLILVFPTAYLFLEHLAALLVSEGQYQV